jgi:hypothetical protein
MKQPSHAPFTEKRGAIIMELGYFCQEKLPCGC